MAELNKPYIRTGVSPYSRQSKPYTRQSEPYSRQTKPYTRQTDPYTRQWLDAVIQKIFQDGVVFTFQDGSKYIYQ